MHTIVFSILSLLIGLFVGYSLKPFKTSGTLKIDTRFDDTDYYLMEFKDDLDDVKNRNYILLKVDNKAKLRK